jgi:signal transduction histidine kinase
LSVIEERARAYDQAQTILGIAEQRHSMRSLYVGILLALAGTLSLALVVFLAISGQIDRNTFYRTFERTDELQLEEARKALDGGGPAAVSAYMQLADRVFGGSHYLLNSSGVDIVSGRDLSSLLPGEGAVEGRQRRAGKLVISRRAADGAYWFIALPPNRPQPWVYFPYYLLVIGATGILCWAAAVWLVSPIRNLTATVERFGRGDLSSRWHTNRRDEIGYLGQAFNETAERLQQLLTSERRLLADISHELRSPLARLKFAVRLARSSPDQAHALDRIERDVDRITFMVSELVEITRAEGDPEARKFEVVDLEQVVNDIVSEERLDAELRECRLQVSGQLEQALWGDPELLRRAVANVLQNAIRYSPSHSAVEVTLAETADISMVEIRDHGPGVAEELLPQIFKPFFRAEESRDTNSGGIGLGLAIAMRAVQVHQGSITAENAKPGLKVRIVLPRLTSKEKLTIKTLDKPISV